MARTGLIFTGLQEGAQLGEGWPHLAKQSRVFHTMCRHAGFWWGGGAAGTQSWLGSARHRSCPGERVCCASLCRIFFLSVSLLLLFPLFAVLLNCPYPDPPVFCPFLSILLRAPAGGRGGHVALLLPGAAETKTDLKTDCAKLVGKKSQKESQAVPGNCHAFLLQQCSQCTTNICLIYCLEMFKI